VITPLGRLAWQGGELSMGESAGPVTMSLRETLLDLQYGRTEDTHGWLHRIV
jgi:branched-chain amino acid aminotransferase